MPDADNAEQLSVDASPDYEIVQDAPVELWKDGITVTVSSRDVPRMLAQGWLTDSPEDIPGLLAEIQILCGTLADNIKLFVEGVTADGFIDPQDGANYAAALQTRYLVDQRIEELLRIAHAAYPMRQAEPSRAVHPVTGEEHLHDPSQHPLLDPEGNLRAVDPAQVERLVGAGWQEV